MAWLDKNGFDTGSHSDMQSKTTHNLSPVEGASLTHGSPAEHKEYADINRTKSDWHYQRWGNHRQPQATLAKAGLHDFRATLAENWDKKR